MSQRRAHRPGATEIPPATVGGHLAKGLHLVELWCNDCVCCVEVGVDDMRHLPIPDIALRFCWSTCGGRSIGSKMIMAELYRSSGSKR